MPKVPAFVLCLKFGLKDVKVKIISAGGFAKRREDNELTYLEKIAAAIEKGDRGVSELIRDALTEGIPAKELLEKGLVVGMDEVGKKFNDGQAYLPEILIAARAAQAALNVLRPAIAQSGEPAKGKIVFGTIEGDLHDIGKNLVRMVLEGEGFEVTDLGVDVSPAQFLEAVKDKAANIVAISALLTTTMPNIPAVLEVLKQNDLRPQVKVMIGGAPVTEAFAREVGVDGFGMDCYQAVDVAKTLLGI
jgi:5-methyltetrahydrofolate--homocysteine methyltransferase